MDHLIYKVLKKKSLDYTPSNLVNEFGFKVCVDLACHMLDDAEWDESLQEYATKVLEEIRKKYRIVWNSTWKYDALLGYAYDIILKYDERFAAFKRAFDKAPSPVPPQLLVGLAHCCWAPGKPPITEKEAISIVKQAIKTTPYIEAIQLLRGLYKFTGNIKEQLYWDSVLEKIKDNGPHLPSLLKI